MTKNISVLFTGDYAPCLGFEPLAQKHGADIFGDLQENIARADLAFINLETSLCVNGKPIKKSGPNLCACTDSIKAVADAGFNMVGLANNHIMDCGPGGLDETMEACKKAGLQTCGAGKNLAEAQKPSFFEKQGIKIAAIAVAEHEFSIAEDNKPGAAPLDPIDNLQQLEFAKANADLVIMTIHGGNEFFPLPRPGLRKVCRFFIERGADAVICHHVHVPGAYEWHQGKPIFYSLGNLVMDHPHPPVDWHQGYAVSLDYQTGCSTPTDFEVIPYTQSVKQGGVIKMKGAEQQSFLEKLAGYNNILLDAGAYADAWTEFCKSKEPALLQRHFSPLQFKQVRKINKRFSLPEAWLPTSLDCEKMNMFRCESHLEMLLNILERKYEKGQI